MKRFTSLFVGLITALSVFSANIYADEAAEAQTLSQTGIFTDVNKDTPNYESIIEMYNLGYIKGYEDGTFRPNGEITRAELVVMLNNVFEYNDIEEYTKTFTDVNQEDWFYSAVMKAGTVGYIEGFPDGSFLPRDNFTRQQFCVALSQTANLSKKDTEEEIKDEVASWASDYVYSVVSNGIMPLENGNFRAYENIKRSEVCAALVSFIEEKDNSETQSTTVAEGSTETTTKIKSSGGGGGGSSSSKKNSSSSSSSSSSSGSSSSSSGSSSSSNASTETSTAASASSNIDDTQSSQEQTYSEPASEATTHTVPKVSELSSEDLAKMKKVVKGLQAAASQVKTDAERELCNYVQNAVNAYIEDTSYNFDSAKNEAKGMYSKLSDDEKANLRKMLLINVDITALTYLASLFGIG